MGICMRILFARHGESTANVHQIISNRDIPHHLTKIGITQSAALSESLLDWKVQKIIASPILRAQETAGVVSKRLGVPFTISHALREFDCGVMEGRKDKEAWAAHNAVNHAWDEKRIMIFI
jgi:probable phosphoglycerate mutase